MKRVARELIANDLHMHRLLFAVMSVALLYASSPASASQIFPGGTVQGEKTLSDPNLTQSGTILLAGTATFDKPLTAVVPFVNTGTLNPSLWATAPEIIVSLTQAEGDLTEGYSLVVSNVNHNTFTIAIRPSTRNRSLRKITLSYIAIGRRS